MVTFLSVVSAYLLIGVFSEFFWRSAEEENWPDYVPPDFQMTLKRVGLWPLAWVYFLKSSL